MKLRILLPAILLTLLLTPVSFAQTPEQSPESSAGVYVIEPEEFYPGTLVLELMEAAEIEIGAAVDEAYAEGYKAATLQYAPEAALYKALALDLEKTIKAERNKNRYFWPVVGVSAVLSFTAGILCSLLTVGR